MPEKTPDSVLFLDGAHEITPDQDFRYYVKRLPTWKEDRIDHLQQAIQARLKRRGFLLDAEDEASDRAQGPEAGKVIDFSYLAYFAYRRTGTEKLGVLKLDMDHMGRFFQDKLAPNKRSMAHTAAISRSLKWFFEGYMNTLLDEPVAKILRETYPGKDLQAYIELFHPTETFRDNLYVLFSGGDDFFVVGAWDVVVEFSWRVYQEFQAFTLGKITLSGGMIVVDPQFPVSRFAALVSEAEHAAKSEDPEEKNRISVFDQVLRWEDFEHAISLRNTLYCLVSKKEFRESKALIHKVKNSVRGFEKIQMLIRQNRSIPLPRLWRLNHYLRDVKKKNFPIVRDKILHPYEEMMMDALSRKIYANPALIVVAARWAEFMSRNIK